MKSITYRTTLLVPSGAAPVPGKMYLRLYHGRTEPDEQLRDWGFDGPMFGPLAGYVHTYCSTFRLIGADHAEEIWLETHGDLIAWDGSYYGDMEVFVAGPSGRVREEREGDEQRDGAEALLAAIRGAIVEANGTTNAGDANAQPPIVIEVRGGVVQDVRNVPPGCEYRIVDHDDLQEQGTPEPTASPALPPDPEGMNGARSGRAARAVRAFQEATGSYDADALSGLVADLMHWADRNNHDFEVAFLRARDRNHAETRRGGRRLPVRAKCARPQRGRRPRPSPFSKEAP